MYKRLITLLVSSCLLFFCKVCIGQATVDTSDNRIVIKETINNFNAAIGPQSWLYNGGNYDLGPRTIKGNPYFMDTIAADLGSVVYYNYTYTDVPLLYNINLDQLVSLRPDGYAKYILTSNKVSKFSLLGHNFIRLDPDSLNVAVVKPGFYDNLYTQKLQVLVKRFKNIHVESSLISPNDYYEPKTYYYLKKDGRYYSISGEGGFLDVLQDHKKELEKYIKANKLKFRKAPEQVMVKLATYYDQITN